MEGKIYVRSGSGNNSGSLKQIAYTTDEIKVSYHLQLYGKRHHSLKKKSAMQNKCWKATNNSSKMLLQSLYKLCSRLIVNNLDLVDSFYGLPSLVGEEIFIEALETDQFLNIDHEVLKHRLHVFTDAYGSDMFQTLNWCNMKMFLAQYIDEVSLFLPYLQCVRLSNCGIGDSHEILLELGKLPQLQCLCLDRNEIGDVGVKNLLQLRRRQKQGLNNLAYLNLSKNNKITVASLSNLCLLPSLKALWIPAIMKKSLSKINLGRFSRQCKKGMDHFKGLNLNKFGNDLITGWGCKLINKWLAAFDLASEQRNKSMENMRQNTNSFYKSSKKKDISYLSPSVSTKISSIAHDDEPAVMLCLCEYRTAPKQNFSKKRKVEDESHFKPNILQPKKAKIVPPLSDKNALLTDVGDDDLLQLYG